MKRKSGRSIRCAVMSATVPVALLIGAGTASAQLGAQRAQPYPQGRNAGPQELFEWQGRVDREIRIQMSRGRASVEQVGNTERTNTRVRALTSVPTQDGIVTVQTLEGRGKVDVVQQPTRDNGYTAIVRLRDPASGAATYRVAAYWQPTGNSGVYRNRRRGNGNGNNNVYDNARDGRSRVNW